MGRLYGSGRPRLLETNGKRGHYTALSYCWGSSGKTHRPYLTTTKTLQKYLLELPWDLLPKTLKDAILLTRAIGVRYIWIDSLCIIQDSKADWEKEAARMGTVYAQARLVIAATAGADAETGLFPLQRYIHHPRKTPRSLHFSKLLRESKSLQHDLPLFTRGWAAQEWVLARRVVFWTHGRMCWLCANEYSLAGDDNRMVSKFGGLFERYTTWDEIVTRYSGRDLSHPGDKLIAIRGIANEIQKRRPKDKYVFGWWQSDIHRGLLWSGQVAPSTDSALKELHIPSWSWASHPGGVQFCPVSWCSPEVRLPPVSFLDGSSLRIMAKSKKIDLHHPDMASYYFSWFRDDEGRLSHNDSFLKSSIVEGKILSIWSRDVGHGSVQVTLLAESIWVVFDRRDFLNTNQNEQDSLGRSAGTPDDFWFVELAEGFGWEVYRTGLVLRKSPDISDRYVRVGVAFAHTNWMKDAEIRKFIVE